MKPQSNVPELTELASKFTVADYKAACDRKDKKAIADALRRRFTERYIVPVTPTKDNRMHGFTMMAVSCLMIESLQSFCEGWKNSEGKSELAFCNFFASHSEFERFRDHSVKFYQNVRCGILHQAETTGGWRITRKADAPLFDASSLKINATIFLKRLREVLADFCDGLEDDTWNSERWEKVRKKMNALCDNCKG